MGCRATDDDDFDDLINGLLKSSILFTNAPSIYRNGTNTRNG
jgi:hypothetical protein